MSTRASSRSTAGGKRNARKAHLEALRQAREQGGRSSQWEAKEETDIYEQVTEQEYSDLVRQRRQGEDFVVDDDGLGYFDDGEEHFGEDEAEGLEAAAPRERGVVHARSADAAKKAKRLKAAREAAGGDEVPEQKSKITKFLGAADGEARKAPRAVSKTAAASLDAFDSLIDGLGGAGGAATPRSAVDLGSGLGAPPSRPAPPSALRDAQLPAAHAALSPPAPRRFSYSALDETPAPPPLWAAAVDLDAAPAPRRARATPLPRAAGMDALGLDGGMDMGLGGDDGMGMGFAAPAPAADDPMETEAAAPKPVAPKQRFSRFSKHATTAAAPSEAAAKAMEAAKAPPPPPAASTDAPAAAPERLAYEEEDDAPAVDPNYGQGGVVTGGLEEKQWLRPGAGEEKPYCWLYWLDCVEQQGTVYMIGKVRLESDDAAAPPAYASACCVVRNVERSFFVLPRVDAATGARKKMQEVWAECRAELVPSCVPRDQPFKCKGVKRGYCFGDDDVPRDPDTEYLKVKYSARCRAPPSSLCKKGGDAIEKILGAGATPLELFLLKRKLMGPCWVKVEAPAHRAHKLSWCALEMEVQDPKRVTVARGCDRPPPPLVCTTLAVKTVVHPKTHQHEVVAVAALTHRGVQLDGATPDGGRGEDARLFRAQAAAAEAHKAGTRRWTCVAARPLGADVAGAQDRPLDPKLPRDLHAELKKPDAHGFLADRGTVTVAPSEKALLTVLLARLEADDPDVLCGHNILGFELDVVLGRALALKVGPAWSKLGRLRRTKPPHKWKAASGRDTFHASATAGRLICDTYLSAREHVRGATTYALAALAHTQLGVRGRRALEPRDVASLLGSGSSNVCGLLRHAAEDCRLVERLALRLQVLPLSKQLTAISGNLLSRTLKGHRAERIEYLLLHEFHRIKYLCPEKQRYDDDDDDVNHNKKGGKKRDRHAGRQKAAYQGGLVLEPKKGFYDSHVLLLDFASLYPSIIQEYDLCFTTVDWAGFAAREAAADGPSAKRIRGDGEEDDDEEVEAADDQVGALPPLPDRGDQASGVLPRVLKAIIDRRREVKGLLKKEKNAKKLELYNIRQMALKLTANSMYGCLGFSHSRFFAKPLAAMVTSLGRDTLQATADVAEKELGLEVIYGDTDSIMINTRTDDLQAVKEMGRKVKESINKKYRLLELELDGIFQTMLLLKKKKYAALVVSEDPRTGQVSTHKETKGLDMVRRDWCPLSKRTGQRVLDFLLSGDAADVVVAHVHKVLEDVGVAARNGDVAVADYVITRGLNKPVEKYPDSKSQPHLRVAKMMLKEGRAVNVGDHIPYVICHAEDGSSSKQTADRTWHPDMVSADTTPAAPAPAQKEGAPAVVTPGGASPKPKIDVEWYLAQQILPPIARLCEPVAGMSRASIATRLGLDARKYTAAMASSAAALAEANANARSFTPMALMSDEERFGDCAAVVVPCGACASAVPLPLWPKPEEGVDAKPTPLQCPSCKAPLMGYGQPAACFSRVSVALQLATRSALKRYYEGWVLCDDAACGARTRQLLGAGPRCCVRGCRGRLVAEVSEKAIYTQLCYQKELFAEDRCAPVPGSGEAEVCKFLRDQVQADIGQSAYNFVRPSIFNVFEKYV